MDDNTKSRVLDSISSYHTKGQKIVHDDVGWLIAELRLAWAEHNHSAIPAWWRKVQDQLDRMEKTLIMTDKNLDAIAKDWPTLRDAITQQLATDTATIASLTAELAETPPDDPRAEEIDGEINTLLQKIQGVVSSTPAPASSAPTTASTSVSSTSAGGTPGAPGVLSTGGPSAGAGTNEQISGVANPGDPSAAPGTPAGAVGGTTTGGTSA